MNMSKSSNGFESEYGAAPQRKLTLQRDKVRVLRLKTGVKTGPDGGGLSIGVPAGKESLTCQWLVGSRTC